MWNRKAKALEGMSRNEEAYHIMQRGVMVEPENQVRFARSVKAPSTPSYRAYHVYAGLVMTQDYQKYSEELRQKAGLAPASATEAKTTGDEGGNAKEDEPLIEEAEKAEA